MLQNVANKLQESWYKKMTYKIEYENGKCCNFAYNRKDLIEWLKLLSDETILDIIKIYKSGASKSVREKYKQYIKKWTV